MKDGRILVVDDEPMVRQSLGQFLGDEGYSVEEAADGADALARVGAHLPDVILLDLMMPRMNGRQFLRALRDDPRYANVPVVVMTAVRGLSVQPTALGASEVVEKPFDVDDLLNKIALAIYRSRQHRQHPTERPVLAPPPPVVEAAPAESGVVLVVDRSRTSLPRLDALLSSSGYTVLSLTRITPQLPRLARVLQARAVLLDQIDGAEEEDEIIEAMRADRALDAVPIIVFTGPLDEALLRFLDR